MNIYSRPDSLILNTPGMKKNELMLLEPQLETCQELIDHEETTSWSKENNSHRPFLTEVKMTRQRRMFIFLLIFLIRFVIIWVKTQNVVTNYFNL